MKITKLNAIAIYVRNLETAKEFYTSKLGFEVYEQMGPGLLLKSNNVTIYLESGRESKNDKTGNSCEISPCFATESIKDFYEYLKSSNVKIASDYVEYGPTFGTFKIVDPDGNLIELAGKP